MEKSANSEQQKGRTGGSDSSTGSVGAAGLTIEKQSAFLSAIFANSPEGMALVDQNLIIRAANESFAKQIHVPLGSVIGRHGEDVVPGWADQMGQILHGVRENGKPFYAEAFPFVFKDQPQRGITYWACSISPLYNADHTFSGYLLLISEVTGRKRSENTIRESEQRYKNIVELTTDILYTSDIDGNMTFLNDAGYKVLDAGPEEVIGQPWIKWIYPEDRERTLKAFHSMIEQGVDVFGFENRYVSTKGKVTISLHNVRVLRDEEGKIIGTLGVARDITDRQRAEEERARILEELRQANEQLLLTGVQVQAQAEDARRRASELETVIESLTDSVFVCDKEGRVVELNQAAMRILGLTKKEGVTGFLVDYVRPLNLRHPDGRPVGMDELALQRALRGEVVRDYEEIARDLWTNNDIDLLLSAAPIRDDQGRIVAAVAVVSDITRIRELDRLKDEFISVAAHELKTPVAVMKGYAQALLRGTEETAPPRRKMLDAINRGADRIDRVVKDLLDISRLHVGHLELSIEKIDLPELVEEVVDRAALTTTKHHVRVVRAEPVVVRGDRDRLEQVLVNLIDNAVKYSPKGGNIDVEVTVQGHEAVVAITDYGVGIPKNKQAGIFQRFYRAHTGTPYDYGGMGVGLYISREIITRHGGRMWFDSEEGKGSTFYLALPLA